jgi:hypothetical protein
LTNFIAKVHAEHGWNSDQQEMSGGQSDAKLEPVSILKAQLLTPSSQEIVVVKSVTAD